MYCWVVDSVQWKPIEGNEQLNVVFIPAGLEESFCKSFVSVLKQCRELYRVGTCGALVKFGLLASMFKLILQICPTHTRPPLKNYLTSYDIH